MSKVGGSPVVCASTDNDSCAKHHIDTEATKIRHGKLSSFVNFQFTVKWGGSGCYIPLLNKYKKTTNNDCLWPSSRITER